MIWSIFFLWKLIEKRFQFRKNFHLLLYLFFECNTLNNKESSLWKESRLRLSKGRKYFSSLLQYEEWNFPLRTSFVNFSWKIPFPNLASTATAAAALKAVMLYESFQRKKITCTHHFVHFSLFWFPPDAPSKPALQFLRFPTVDS